MYNICLSQRKKILKQVLTWSRSLFYFPIAEKHLTLMILHGNSSRCFIGFVCHIQWLWNYFLLLSNRVWTIMCSYDFICTLKKYFFFPQGILEVLHCVLVESPEALNIIKEGHIKSIICLLDKHGRNHKVSKG